jgi:hypothetical protein
MCNRLQKNKSNWIIGLLIVFFFFWSKMLFHMDLNYLINWFKKKYFNSLISIVVKEKFMALFKT